MKKLLLIVGLSLAVGNGVAQTNQLPDSIRFQHVYEACIQFRDAVAADDTAALGAASKQLHEDAAYFSTLTCRDDTVASLNGHIVFDEYFAEQYTLDKDVALQRADSIEWGNSNRCSGECSNRGQNADGSILTRTCFVKANGETRYRFRSRNEQRLAVVAESGGRISLKIHVTNSRGLDCHLDSTEDVKAGRSHREVTFRPSDEDKNRSNLFELTVVNCCNQDISFVVISN